MRNLLLSNLLLFIVFSFQSCNKDNVEQIVTPIAIGDFHQGGVVFYIDATGEHGLVCAVVDQGFDIEWGCPSLIGFGAKGLEIGTGAQNTQDILNACNTPNIAASLCDGLVSNGFDDWFLPCRDELDSLYQHKNIIDDTSLDHEGGVLHGGEYWSSSHYLDNTVWIQSFVAGNQFSALKDKKHYVRAVRAF